MNLFFKIKDFEAESNRKFIHILKLSFTKLVSFDPFFGLSSLLSFAKNKKIN